MCIKKDKSYRFYVKYLAHPVFYYFSITCLDNVVYDKINILTTRYDDSFECVMVKIVQLGRL